MSVLKGYKLGLMNTDSRLQYSLKSLKECAPVAFLFKSEQIVFEVLRQDKQTSPNISSQVENFSLDKISVEILPRSTIFYIYIYIKKKKRDLLVLSWNAE